MDAADLAFAGLARQAELVRAGEVSSRELTELYLDRIARLDPRLNAYRIVLADEALANADAADRRRGDDAPSLNGVPIAIKDDTDVEGQVTAHGSFAHDFVPAQDAEGVRRLRAAGTVILGKTNVPELEALCVTESLAYGATCNPWDPSRTSGGSSGGSGTAVAAGLAAAALGTDGAGSIRIPAAACGLVGLKPQRDRVPMTTNWYGMSVTGALTRSARDSALFLDAIKDGGPAYADVEPPGALRIAFSVAMPRGVTGRLETEQRDGVRATAERLRGLGHTVEEYDPDYGNSAANVVTRYLEGVNGDAEGMPHPERLARWTRGLAGLGAKIPGPLVRRAHAQEAGDRERVNALFADFDVLLLPALTRRPPRVGEWLGQPAPLMLNQMATFTAHLALWNHTGQPAISVPAEPAADGFPVGAQLVGPPDGEPLLLALAAQLEEATGWTERRPPEPA